MYRRGDPRWNRTIQHIADNFEHANDTAQENLWTFTHVYIDPCVSSITSCLNSCTAQCFPSRDDRRRTRRQVCGGAEQSFDFYDDWEDDENDGLLGWGNDELDRLWAGSSNNHNYGAVTQVTQPGRQRRMSFGQRNRDPRFNSGRRKSAVQPHDGGPDPTIIPSSSYFGFLGRLPFNVGRKGLKYKPSAADLTEHPGQARRSQEEEQPLIEDSNEDDDQRSDERKSHRRQRSHTITSGHTTDSLSSRGDIFPSEDELDDAVPLDDEFTMSLERRTTNQWHDDTSSGKTRGSNTRPAGSRMSTRTVSSGKRSHDSGRRSGEDVPEIATMLDLKQEEERVKMEEEEDIQRRRQDAQQLARKKGLASDLHLNRRSPSPSSNLPHLHYNDNYPTFDVQTAPDSGSFHIDESDYSSLAPTPNRPLSLRDVSRVVEEESTFIPARLPHFSSHPY
ncbi:hypothetical protein K504DRAFT_377106 [Pleomassaria siparia CBS 279.74]|uniref:Uncharacterized protein n=1 Tax=Pleomassaria siparia CBS 279.74 TaxID=1314801 RepID=A0A6G1KD37_9PLEO|nr:hypothetical protein K504DRAFT_377106 [Pleomassaria siparia CBS 279.74]